jgi:RNA polymerase sigma-70 factor (ECF subfamily)
MTEHTAEQVREKVDAVYRSESRRIFATLIRLLGDFEPAEDALHDAFSAALEQWPKGGVPANPRAWLVSAGRFNSLWNRDQIAEGKALVERALSSRRFGPYALQAAIAAVYANAPNAADTDWAQIVGLYDVLVRVEPSPVVELNRAVAVAMRDGPEAGLALIDAILARSDLADYHLAHAARADLCRRRGRTAEARASYEIALTLARQEPERRFLERRLAELG